MIESFRLDIIVYPELGMDALTVETQCPASEPKTQNLEPNHELGMDALTVVTPFSTDRARLCLP